MARPWKPMNLLSTFAGSMMEGFLPAGWDLARIDACALLSPETSASDRAGGTRTSS